MIELQERFKLAMRGTVSGVAVVTAGTADERVGVTVSSLSSLSVEPPSIVVAIHSKSRALATIEEHGFFAASILSGNQMHLAEIFAGRRPDLAGDRFNHARWGTLTSGAPILGGAVASFDCRLAKVVAFASHKILLGEVLELEYETAPALLYSNGQFGAYEAVLETCAG